MVADHRLITSVDQMRELAAESLRRASRGGVLLLSGPLGAGKTTFVQALAEELGVTETVNSPSYTIAAEYAVTGHPTITRLVHIDLYRLAQEEAVQDVAVQAVLDEVGEPGRLTVIEWAERLPVKSLRDHGARGRWIRFQHGATEGERLVDFE